MDGIIFDKKAINSLKHNITHLRDLFIKQPVTQERLEKENYVEYVVDKLKAILVIIKMAEEFSKVVEKETSEDDLRECRFKNIEKEKGGNHIWIPMVSQKICQSKAPSI